MNKRSNGWLWIFVLVYLASGSVLGRDEQALGYRLTPIEPPVQAPAFLLEDMDGERHTLEDFHGQVVLMNFWASWCPPCRREMPSLERLYLNMKGKPFTVLAVNQWETPDHVFAYLGDLGVFPTFPILFDRNSAVAEAFGVKGLPTTVILDKQGRIAYRAIGGREFDHPEVKKIIDTLLLQ
jgi:thiol-disulfide isomerase/thioredoxin